LELTIKDIASLLMIPEKEVRSLVKKNGIPFQKIDDKELFNKQQIIEWALIRNLPLNIANHTKMSEYQLWNLNSIITENSFFYDCDFDESHFIEQMVDKIDVGNNVDKGIIIQLLRNREELMSTAIGNGISLPHPRIPLMVGKNKPIINIFFPKRTLELKSLDAKPVHTIILVISQTIKQHLSLLAQMFFLLSNETFQSALINRLNSQEILKIIEQIDKPRG